MNFQTSIFMKILLLAILFVTEVESQTTSSETGLNWKFEHDDAGRITKLIDPGGKATQVKYEFNPAKPNLVHRVTQIAPDNALTIFTYDELGRRILMQDALGKVRYEYESSWQIKAVRRDNMPAILYSYDTMNRLSSLSVGEKMTVKYAYDFLGRLSKMSTPVGDIAYEYANAQGRTIRALPNGIRTAWDYGPDGRLTSITHVDKNDYVIAQYTHTYCSDGLVSKIREWSTHGEKILSYEYDLANRLITVTDSLGETIHYSYDQLGNRTEIHSGSDPPIFCNYDWASRLLTYNGLPCTYDPCGNITSYDSASRHRRFEYDAWNLLKAANQVTYQYDGDGYLIARTVENTTTTFIPMPAIDFWQPLLVTQTSGSQTFYVWEKNLPLAVITSNNVEFFLHDYLGSVRYIVNLAGDIAHEINYNPLGAPQQEFVRTDLQPGFAGWFFDSVALLYVTYLRTYNPLMGRYLQHELTPLNLTTVIVKSQD